MDIGTIRERTMTFSKQIGCATVLAIASALMSLPATAHDITAEWGSVKPPPVPQLKPVTVDPKTTALLVFDFMKGNCGARPRCVASVPSVKKLIDAARANNMMISYNLTGQNPKFEDMVDQSIIPRAGEHLVKNGRGANKFYNSDLEQALKAKGITTVIITGTSAQGAVAGSTQGATERGFKAIVPVDGMSAEDAFNEQYAAWHLAKGGPAALVENVTVTRSDLIKFGN
jgi:nicotinamidase-related amidase